MTVHAQVRAATKPLRDRRKELGISYANLATAVNVSESTCRRALVGLSSMKNVKAIARVLGLKLEVSLD